MKTMPRAASPVSDASVWTSTLDGEQASAAGVLPVPPDPLHISPLPDPALPPKPAKPSGWLVGIVLGVLVGLWLLPPVRYTFGSQLRFALAQDGLPWALTLDSQRSLREAPRLDATAAILPDDYLLQVGRATAFVELGGVKAAPASEVAPADDAPDTSDHTLARLTRVAHDFPLAAGAQAHLARYMMVDRVRIQRAELAEKTEEQGKGKREKGKEEDSSFILHPSSLTIPARYTDVKLMRWALSNGERLDPDNVFWPAMLASAYFAAGRDTQALAALARCEQKTRWDSYIYEEVLGQWRLYSLTYGDHGATQKIGPLSRIAFPHLRELRRMAEMARWHADQEANRGHVREAIQIRQHVLRLGILLRDTATWAYEALYGTDLILIAASDKAVTPRQTTVRTVGQWQEQAREYLAFLEAHGKKSEVTVLTAEVEESCKLRAQVDIARADSSYPGVPPGIPLVPLFGAWMTGVCLVQQMLLLAISVGVARLLQIGMERRTQTSRAARLTGRFVITATTLISGAFLLTAFVSSRLAIVFLIGSGCLFALTANMLQRQWWRWKRTSDLDSYACRQKRIDQKWNRGTTWRMLICLLTPCLVALWLLRPLLSSLHPVAQLLTSLMEMEPPISHARIFQVALLSCAIPLVFALGLSLWALWRNTPVLATLTIGLRRLFLPAMTSLVLVYILLLQQTLGLDTESTHAINEVARDDLHWVLTHSEGK